MACFLAKNALFKNGNSLFIATTTSSLHSTVGKRPMLGLVPSKPLLVLSCDSRNSYSSLVLKAVSLLGPPNRFEASKLKVVYMGEDIERQPPDRIVPRAYTLTHCDFTANLTLSVSNNITYDMLREWKTTLQRDDVVAEWKKVKDVMSLHVHCYVSGANPFQELAAEFRYHIFSKELPLVLKAVIYGDSALFNEHPELMESVVWVYFHSNSNKFNKVECWGPLKDACQRTFHTRSNGLQRSFLSKWANPGTIFNAFFAFLL